MNLLLSKTPFFVRVSIDYILALSAPGKPLKAIVAAHVLFVHTDHVFFGRPPYKIAEDETMKAVR